MIISKVIFILGVIALFALSDAASDGRNRRPKSSSSSSPSSSSSSSGKGKGKGGKCHGHGTCTYFIHAEQKRRNQWEGTSLKIEAPGGHITGTTTAHGPTKDCVSKSGEHKGAFPKCFNAAAKFSINCGEKAEISWVSSDHRPNDNINYQLFQSAKAPHTQPPASEGFTLAKESKNRQTLIVECGSSGDVNDPSKVTFGVFTTAKLIVPDELSFDECPTVLWDKCKHDADCCEGKCYRKNSSYSQCRPQCPGPDQVNNAIWTDWDCYNEEHPVHECLALNTKCNEGVPCCEGGYCFERGPFYSACKKECPEDWECNSNECLALNTRCDGDAYVEGLRCCDGTHCFVNGPGWSACKTRCPKDWTCKLYNGLE
ncbi:hypothetical protein TrVE_jg10371 [Triparma verrucosa]|uniref:Uncharacterized protein n=1 Tax=Triparma verrucosa TaxID=1606542 RepID=A0A9W7KUW0_9STRA|nr:hypothetical protein TrVE_jg10371 [Triparma verrucosa]